MRVLCIVVLLVTILAVILTGCGGGSSSLTDSPLTPGVSLTIGADTAYAVSSASNLTLKAKINAGAVISVVDFRTGVVMTTGAIGMTGFGAVRVTAGTNVVILVDGTSNGRTYRLSSVLSSVPAYSTTLVIDPATTLAAEALAASYYKRGAVAKSRVDAANAAAVTFLTGHPTADVALGKGLLNSGVAFGVAGAINTVTLQPILAAAQAADSRLETAKNMVAQMKEAGAPMQFITAVEMPKLRGLYANYTQAMQSVDLDTLTSSLNGVDDRFTQLLMPAILGSWQMTSDYESFSTICQLIIGKGYRAIEHIDEEEGYRWISLSGEAASNTPGQVTVRMPTAKGTVWLIGKKLPSGSWELTQTFSADPTLLYKVIMPPYPFKAGVNPRVTIGFSLKDKGLPIPIAYTGTFSATGPDIKHYTQISYTGTFTSKRITFGGTMSASFRSYAPDSPLAGSGESIYKFPTRVQFSGIHMSANDNGNSVALTGDVDVHFVVTRVDGEPQNSVSAYNMRNASLAVSLAGRSLTLTGESTVTQEYAYDSEGNVVTIPTSIILNNACLNMKTTATQVVFTGAARMTGKAYLLDGEPKSMPTEIALTGKYSDSASFVTFNGLLAGTFTNANARDDLDYMTAQAALLMKGSLKRASYQAYDVDIEARYDGNHHLNITFAKLAFGAVTLTGSYVETVIQDATGGLQQSGPANLTLRNQNGAELTITFFQSGVVTGAITVAGEKQATIKKYQGVLTVYYTDSTHEALL